MKMYCGPSCIKYILEEMGIKDYEIGLKIHWIMELALALKKNHVDGKIRCYNSDLYTDYLSREVDLSFEGFKYLKEAIDNNIEIEEVKLDIKQLERELRENKYIILCVELGKFNNNNSNTGHFIVLNKTYAGKVKVINPVDDGYEHLKKEKEEIIEYCENFGSWRILIKGE